MSTSLSTIRKLLGILKIVQVPILAALGVLLLLFVPDQLLEIYRALALDVGVYGRPEYWRVFLLGVGGLMMMSLALYAVSLFLLRQFRSRVAPLEGPLAALERWAPLVLATAPLIGAVLGAYRASLAPSAGVSNLAGLEDRLVAEITEVLAYSDPDHPLQNAVSAIPIVNDMFSYGLWGALWRGIAVVLLLYAPVLLALYAHTRRIYANGKMSYASVVAAYALLLAASLAFAVSSLIFPVVVPQWSGSIFVAGVFVVLAVSAFGALSYLSQRTHLPVTLAVVLFIALLSWSNFNNNHRLRTIAERNANAKAAAALPNMGESFEAWLEARPDRCLYERYPVYIVAAQGGGIYAAYHAAALLSSLERQVPEFRHHLFAVSGVSGGSVGASVFASLLNASFPDGSANSCQSANGAAAQTQAKEQEGGFDLVYASDDVFSHDLLAPLVAAMVFRESLQGLIPWPIPALDRARVLEYALEQAWDEEIKIRVNPEAAEVAQQRDLLVGAYLDHWHPDRSLPALLLNTTEVGTGRRRVFAPFRFSSTDLQFFDPGLEGRVRLSTAAVLSARFPGMTPAGWFETEKPRQRVSLVDGGYFENSGSTTALELFQELEKLPAAVDLKMIILTSDKPKFYDYAELGDSVRTLLNTGVSRALLAVRAAERHIDGDEPHGACTLTGKLLKVELEEQLYPLPLGWKWSDATRFLVRTQKGDADEGVPGKAEAASDQDKKYSADCVAWHVRQQIQGNRKDASAPPR